ncbi:hypothetical protein ACJW30_03G047500 [Castanea mollissima]
MAGSTSIPPNTSIQLDHVHCSNPHQLNQKDQASSTVESYLVQPSTPSPPPPSNSAPNQLHLPQQNLSTLPPPPPNLGQKPQPAQPSEPITYNLNPPALFVVSSNSQPNTSAPPPSQGSNPTHVPNHFQENTVSEPSNASKPALQQLTYGNPQKRNLANKAANLANLLPTGTVLFQALTPSLANSTGKCQYFNKYLIGFVIIICAATCFLSSFTDCFMVDGKLYYGFATFKDFWVLNYDSNTSQNVKNKVRENRKNHNIKPKDYVHAFGSLLVFLIFAFSSSDVLHCFFPDGGENRYSMVLYLPLVSGVLSSFLFSLFPTQLCF